MCFVSAQTLTECYEISFIRLDLTESHQPVPSGEITVWADTEPCRPQSQMQPLLRRHPVCDLWEDTVLEKHLDIRDTSDIFSIRATEILE